MARGCHANGTDDRLWEVDEVIVEIHGSVYLCVMGRVKRLYVAEGWRLEDTQSPIYGTHQSAHRSLDSAVSEIHECRPCRYNTPTVSSLLAAISNYGKEIERKLFAITMLYPDLVSRSAKTISRSIQFMCISYTSPIIYNSNAYQIHSNAYGF